MINSGDSNNTAVRNKTPATINRFLTNLFDLLLIGKCYCRGRTNLNKFVEMVFRRELILNVR